jgi:hypothetical protein
MSSNKIRKNTGVGNRGKGRPKGALNKATKAFRDTITELLENNSDNVSEWLEQVATGSHGKDPDPGKALDLLAKLAEFAAPKLSRAEHVGNPETPVQHLVKWQD